MVWFSPVCFLFLYSLGDVCGASEEWDLLEKLLNGYDTAVRPVSEVSDVLNFTMDVSLNQVIDVDERNQIIKLNIWMRWYWVDSYLKWNSSEYGGIKDVYIQPKRIWIPDVTLYNSVSTTDHGWPSHYNAKIHYDGSVTYLFPAYLEASCKIDVTHFPFDTQSCVLTFGSWAYSGAQLDMYPYAPLGNWENFVENGEWELLSIPSRRNVKYYPCCPEPFPDVKFTIVLKRLPLYHVYNLLMPCILITCINLFTFLLPVESGEKISLNVTVLLTMVVFLLIVAEIMPPQSEVIPIIGMYFGVCIVLLSLGTLASVFVIHLHFRGSRGRLVPSWLKCIFRWLGFITCYRETLAVANFRPDSKSGDCHTVKPQTYEFKDPGMKAGKGEMNGHYVPEVEIQAPGDKREATAEKEWVTVALILDRVFFFLFLISTGTITGYVLSYL
ncbi:neuronal acetylcholine receptor subunit alpha-10-like [Liolophura sinensis]|uniref:neuronal acetylcholine receptor subunit alpha-10-like n=1 Tax=Liolophura sinensis TaxID=3198878 RepID=UPI0031593C42